MTVLGRGRGLMWLGVEWGSGGVKGWDRGGLCIGIHAWWCVIHRIEVKFHA